MSAPIRHLRTVSDASTDDPVRVGAGGGEWPTTLRFSRRLGEALRNADYAITVEGPDGRPLPFLKPPPSGFARRLARLMARLRR